MRAFWLDVVFGTMFVFVIMGVFKYTFDRVQLLDPVGDAIGDTEITDIVFSQLREEPLAEERIVLVNLAWERHEIAAQLDILSKYNPAIIGIDAELYSPKADFIDSILEASLANAKNVIVPHRLISYNDELGYFDSVRYPLDRFEQVSDEAFVNLITPAGEQDEFKIVRSFTPKENLNGREVYAFGVRLAQYLDPERTKKFIDRNNDFELINFKRNIIDWHKAGKWSGKFPALDIDEVMTENFVPEMIEGKIVILGYLGNDFFDTSWDDKFFTPLNMQYAGKTNPDMYGAVVHANIAAMVLNEDYIDHMGENSGTILGIILCFLNVALFSLIYKRLDQWYDGLTKLIQIFELILLFGLVIFVFNAYSYKLEMTVSLVAIALAGDALEVYFGVIKNLFSTKGRRTLFRKKTGESAGMSEEDVQLYTKIFWKMEISLFQEFIALSKEEEVHSGKMIIEEGKVTDKLFLLKEGVAEIFVGEEKIAEVENGKFIGEMSFLTEKVPMASVKTKQDCVLVTWNKKNLKDMVEQDANFEVELRDVLDEDIIQKLTRQNLQKIKNSEGKKKIVESNKELNN